MSCIPSLGLLLRREKKNGVKSVYFFTLHCMKPTNNSNNTSWLDSSRKEERRVSASSFRLDDGTATHYYYFGYKARLYFWRTKKMLYGRVMITRTTTVVWMAVRRVKVVFGECRRQKEKEWYLLRWTAWQSLFPYFLSELLFHRGI